MFPVIRKRIQSPHFCRKSSFEAGGDGGPVQTEVPAATPFRED